MPTLKRRLRDGTNTTVDGSTPGFIEIDVIGGGGGSDYPDVQAVTLTATTAITVDMAGTETPWPDDKIVGLLIVQDSTGGWIAHFDGEGLPIATEPNAKTLVLMVPVGGGDFAALVPMSANSTPYVPSGDVTAPSTPTSLVASATSGTAISLSWTASTDNVAVTGYEYRIDGGTAVDAGPGTGQIVTGLTPGVEYDFEVRAYDASGNRSGWSNVATETTTVVFSDNFNRADNASTLGADWTVVAGTWGIASNKAYPAAAGSLIRVVHDIGLSTGFTVQATMSTVGPDIRLIARYTDTSNEIVAVGNPTPGVAGGWAVFARVGGVLGSPIIAWTQSPGATDGDVVRLVLNGTNIALYVNGTLKGSATGGLSGVPAGTKVGMAVNNSTTPRWDDFIVT